MKSYPRLTTRLLPLLVLILVVMQVIDPSNVWKILLVGLGGLWLVSYIWARSLFYGLQVIREMRFGWVQVGDVMEERFTLINKSWFPATWVEIEDQSSLPGYDASLATGVDGQGKTQWRKQGTCNRRGLYQLGETSLLTGDPFGIYSVRVTDPGKATLMILPPIVPLPRLEVTPGGYSGEGRPIPNAPERTVDASSVREYVPGDSLRLMHWKTTARQAKPYVRLFDGTPASDWWILLDLEEESQIGFGNDSTEEHGVLLAASLTDRGLRSHFGVGLVLNGKHLNWLPPRSGTGQSWEILRLLALTSKGKNKLGEVLEHIRPNLGRNASLLIITPTDKLDWLKTLPMLEHRGIHSTVFLLDRSSFNNEMNNSKVAIEIKKIHITCHTIPREFMNRPEAHPGTRGQWEWRVTPTGRAIPIHSPENFNWQRLAK